MPLMRKLASGPWRDVQRPREAVWIQYWTHDYRRDVQGFTQPFLWSDREGVVMFKASRSRFYGQIEDHVKNSADLWS